LTTSLCVTEKFSAVITGDDGAGINGIRRGGGVGWVEGAASEEVLSNIDCHGRGKAKRGSGYIKKGEELLPESWGRVLPFCQGPSQSRKVFIVAVNEGRGGFVCSSKSR